MRNQQYPRERSAVLAESGKSVYPSDPVLIEPTPPATSGRTPGACVERQQGAKLRPAAHQPKTGRGLGQRPSSAAGAVPASLDTIQSNRDSLPAPKRRCGQFTVRGTSAKLPGKARFCWVGCKCWDCVRCGPRKASKYRCDIRRAAEHYKLNKLLTLTLDPKKLEGQDSTKYINQVFADFRVYLKRKLGHSPDYIRVLEYHKSGTAHLHILLGGCYLSQQWVSDAWAALGGGRVVDIRRVDMHRISHYLSKYLTKQMLLQAPKGARRVTTSRSIRLRRKTLCDFLWSLVGIPIQRLYDVHRATVHEEFRDAEGLLVGFVAAWETGNFPVSKGT